MSAPRFFLARPLLPGFWPSLGVSLVYLHVVILVPLLVLLWHAADLGWAQYWAAISDPRVVASYRVTLLGAFISTVVVTLVGLLLAWVLSRYEFPGRRFLDALIDLPFALPTAGSRWPPCSRPAAGSDSSSPPGASRSPMPSRGWSSP